jgi:hypothetical protein
MMKYLEKAFDLVLVLVGAVAVVAFTI